MISPRAPFRKRGWCVTGPHAPPDDDAPAPVLPLAAADDLTVRRLDFLPIALAFLRKLNVAATIDAAIPAPPPGPPSALAQALGLPPPKPPPSVGVCAEAMILNILEGRVALSNMEIWLRGLDLGSLWGADVQPAQFTDDRLARSLDGIFEAGPETLYSQIVVTPGRVFCVELDRLHFDTSTLSTSGAHAVPADAPDPRAVHGHSKDHRPDLLQWVFGMTVQHEGLPVLSTLLDGNTADSLVHRAHLEMLATQVRDPASTTFVSDSKGCNAASLGLLRYLNFHFTTLLPHTFTAHDIAIEAGLKQPKAWCELERKQAGEAPARVWRGCVVPVTLPMLWPDPESEGFPCEARFNAVVVHSTELARTHASTQATRIDKGRRRLAKQSARLATTNYATEMEAEAAARSFVATHAVGGLTVATTIEGAKVRQKRSQRGRPRADEVPTYLSVFRVVTAVTDDVAAQAAAAQQWALRAGHVALHQTRSPCHEDVRGVPRPGGCRGRLPLDQGTGTGRADPVADPDADRRAELPVHGHVAALPPATTRDPPCHGDDGDDGAGAEQSPDTEADHTGTDEPARRGLRRAGDDSYGFPCVARRLEALHTQILTCLDLPLDLYRPSPEIRGPT